jgi:hypothetical protein
MLLRWVSKGTKGGYFYHSKEQNVLVRIHAKYLEDDQKMSTSSSSLVELEEDTSSSLEQNDQIKETREAQPNIPIQAKPHCSGRVTRVSERWTREIFDLVFQYQEHDPTRYDEAIANIAAD